MTELESGRDILAAAVKESVLLKYERLRRNKGGSAIVGVEHSACGGCHMRLPPQIVLACQGQHEIVTCPNCGRIVYFTHDMITQFKD